MSGYFVTGTGTGEGKTYVTRGLARLAHLARIDVAAVKPIETGVDGGPLDALALARACGRPTAHLPGLYRATLPLAPYSATLRGAPPVPPTDELCATLHAISAELLLVEGAGGVLVPLDEQRSIADLIAALRLPALLVARNGLGVISHVRCSHEALSQRGVITAAVVLTDHGPTDTSQADNHAVLTTLLGCPVVRFAASDDDDDALAKAAAPLWSVLQSDPASR